MLWYGMGLMVVMDWVRLDWVYGMIYAFSFCLFFFFLCCLALDLALGLGWFGWSGGL